MIPITVCIGYDPNESVAFHVLAHSILRQASRPVSIVPLVQCQLRNIKAYDRPRTPLESTEFSFSRFLTPWLAGGGISIFMDCDMLCRGDIAELEALAWDSPYNDVLVVQHPRYEPSTPFKFLNQQQTSYPCKNWSSVMVFNGHRTATRNLTREVVNMQSGMYLHQFRWATNIGELPPEWNHLVGEQPHNKDAKLIHYTLGGPWFTGYEHCEFSEEWFAEYQLMNHCETRPHQ